MSATTTRYFDGLDREVTHAELVDFYLTEYPWDQFASFPSFVTKKCKKSPASQAEALQAEQAAVAQKSPVPIVSFLREKVTIDDLLYAGF